MKNQTRMFARVEGQVQGVGFRQFVYMTAASLDLTGWVRNTYEGDVEVLAEGDADVLENLLAALQKGPRMAFVTRVDHEYHPASGEFEDFRVRSTATGSFPGE